jgi:hypothetical protein
MLSNADAAALRHGLLQSIELKNCIAYLMALQLLKEGPTAAEYALTP